MTPSAAIPATDAGCEHAIPDSESPASRLASASVAPTRRRGPTVGRPTARGGGHGPSFAHAWEHTPPGRAGVSRRPLLQPPVQPHLVRIPEPAHAAEEK